MAAPGKPVFVVPTRSEIWPPFPATARSTARQQSGVATFQSPFHRPMPWRAGALTDRSKTPPPSPLTQIPEFGSCQNKRPRSSYFLPQSTHCRHDRASTLPLSPQIPAIPRQEFLIRESVPHVEHRFRFARLAPAGQPLSTAVKKMLRTPPLKIFPRSASPDLTARFQKRSHRFEQLRR